MARKKSLKDIQDQLSRIAGVVLDNGGDVNVRRYSRAYDIAERYKNNILNSKSYTAKNNKLNNNAAQNFIMQRTGFSQRIYMGLTNG